MFAPMQEFASDRLRGAEREDALRRHAEYFAHLERHRPPGTRLELRPADHGARAAHNVADHFALRAAERASRRHVPRAGDGATSGDSSRRAVSGAFSQPKTLRPPY